MMQKEELTRKENWILISLESDSSNENPKSLGQDVKFHKTVYQISLVCFRSYMKLVNKTTGMGSLSKNLKEPMHQEDSILVLTGHTSRKVRRSRVRILKLTCWEITSRVTIVKQVLCTHGLKIDITPKSIIVCVLLDWHVCKTPI